MARAKNQGLLIAGGGVAASLAALAMARLRPDVPVLLVAEEASLGGGDTLSFFNEELSGEEYQLVEQLIDERWPGYYVAFASGSRKIKADYSSIAPGRIDQAVREALGERCRTGARIVAVREDSLILQGGEKLEAEAAVDAREATNLSMLDLGWRRLTTRDYQFKAPHRVDRPVLIDATEAGTLGGRFASCVPLGEQRLLVGDVEYSASANGDAGGGPTRIDAYVQKRGWQGGAVLAEASSALPVALGGDFQAFWRFGGARVAKLGPRGGLFHPATGSPLADAVRTALLLTRQRELSGAALHDLFADFAGASWNRRDFYRSFNALLMDKGNEPLERLYSQDPGLIARFHSERLGMLDRRRIMSAAGR